MEEEVELRAEGGVPEEGEGGLVRRGEEADAGVGGEGCEEGLRGGTAQGGGVDGGEEDAEGGGWRGGGEVREEEGEEGGGLRGEVWTGGGEGGEDGCEDGGGGAGGVGAVYDDGGGWSGGGACGVKVFGEGGQEGAFGAVAVEAEGEGLGELEGPLWEGARVEGVQEGDGWGVRVPVGGDEGMVGGVGEEGEGGERIGGGFDLAGAVLEEVGFVRGEVGRGCNGAVSSAFGSAGAALRRGCCWSDFCVCCCCFVCLLVVLFFLLRFPILVDLLRESVFLVNAVVIAQIPGNGALNEVPCALTTG